MPNVVMKHGGRSYDLNSWRAGKLPSSMSMRQSGRPAGSGGDPAADAAAGGGGNAVEAQLGDHASVASVRAYHDAVHASEVAAGRPHALQLEGYGNEAGHLYLHHLRSHCHCSGGGGGGGPDDAQEAGGQRGRAAASTAVAATATEGHAHLTAASQLSPSGAEGRDGTASSPSPCVVRLDAIGGAVLLVRGDLHRQGLVFPPFPFRHRIETEGLSMMALDMGVLSWGMPLLEVIHH